MYNMKLEVARNTDYISIAWSPLYWNTEINSEMSLSSITMLITSHIDHDDMLEQYNG